MERTVLVVDDQPGARRALAIELEDAGFRVVEAADGSEGWKRFCSQHPDVVVTDMVMPGSDGIDLVGRVRSRSDVPVIVFTAYGTMETAVAALKSGADEFISSSETQIEGIVELVKRTLDKGATASGHPELEERLVGTSKTMARVRQRISGLTPLRTPVLVSGEPGAGRDTAVLALHELGPASGTSLVHVPGQSFRPGSERVQNCGAIYLDGVEALSRKAQAYWAEQLGKAEREDPGKPARLFASTTLDLGALVKKGLFEESLADVLTRFRIELPPLRDRVEDIPAITEAIVRRVAHALGRDRIRMSPDAIDCLKTRPWPGNVKQLHQVLERVVAFSRSREVRRRTVEDVLREFEESLATIRDRHSFQELDRTLSVLHQTGGNVSQAAAILGKSRSAVYRLIARHGIRLRRRD